MGQVPRGRQKAAEKKWAAPQKQQAIRPPVKPGVVGALTFLLEKEVEE